jgi:hypothetical protein
MIQTKRTRVSSLDKLTKQSVRSFWMDGLWDIVIAGMLLIVAIWGYFYTQFAVFPSWTWPFLKESGKIMVWAGLFLLVMGLSIYFWIMWIVVKKLKRLWVYPYTGYAEHPFFLSMDQKVFIWYSILYLFGFGILYGLFSWISGGSRVMSIPLIISPAAILFGIGWLYGIRRYLFLSGLGLILALLLELFLTTSANYFTGPRSVLDTLPQSGSPALPSLVWAGMFLISGLIGLLRLLNLRSQQHGT